MLQPKSLIFDKNNSVDEWWSVGMDARCAVVTGASRGIGRAIAYELACRGMNIVVNYRASEQDAKGSAELIRGTGQHAFVFRADVTNREQVKGMFGAALSEFGRIDVLVNNAGVLEQKPFGDIDDYEWQLSMDVNLNSAFICTQEASPRLNSGGCIINVSSMGGQIGGPRAPHYSAAKGALLTFTKSSARLLAPRIRVNAVTPGFIRTDMFEHITKNGGQTETAIVETIPMGRLGEPGDVATAVAFLASPEASYITGHTLNINGGILM